MNKQSTQLPLSPEERQYASEQVGRALFAALQLSGEQDRERMKALRKRQSSTLSIPIPAELLNHAQAGAPAQAPQPAASPKVDPMAFFGFNKTSAASFDNIVDPTAAGRRHEVVIGPDGQPTVNSFDHAGIPHVSSKSNPGAVSTGLKGGLAAALLGAPVLPVALAGSALGTIMSDDKGRTGLKHQSEYTDAEGNTRHVYDVENASGPTSMLKRNVGALAGLAGGGMAGAKIMKMMGKGKLMTLLGAGGLALTGKRFGDKFDDWNKRNDREEAGNDPSQLSAILADAALRQGVKEKTGADGVLANAIGSVMNHPARLMFNGQMGFREAQKEYFDQERARIQKDIAAAHQEYLQTLQQIRAKTGSAEETPHVDAFCNGLTYEALMHKQSDHRDIGIADDSLKQLARQLLHTASRPVRPAIDAAAGTALGLTGGAAQLTMLLRKKMREQPLGYTEAQLPTRIELTPA